MDCQPECSICKAQDAAYKAHIAELERKLAVARECIAWYAEPSNYSIDYDTSGLVTRRVILFRDQEEINEATTVAGQRARKALEEIK